MAALRTGYKFIRSGDENSKCTCIRVHIMQVLYTLVVPSVGSRIVPHIVSCCVACRHHVVDVRTDVSLLGCVVEFKVTTFLVLASNR